VLLLLHQQRMFPIGTESRNQQLQPLLMIISGVSQLMDN